MPSPRTSKAVGRWEKFHRREFPPSPGLDDVAALLEPQESVRWLTPGLDLTSRREVVVALTDRRCLISSGSRRSRLVVPVHKVGRHQELDGVVLDVGLPFRQTRPIRVGSLPARVLATLAAAPAPRSVPVPREVPVPSLWRTSSTEPGPVRRTTRRNLERARGAGPPVGRATDEQLTVRSAARHHPAPEGPAITTWQEAERFAAVHLRSLGFTDATVTAAGPDGGLDVVAAEAGAQVKFFETTAIGAPFVQQLKGAAHGRRWAVFYASSGYTAAAVGYADQAGVALLVFSPAGTVTPASSAARALLSRAGGSPSAGSVEDVLTATRYGQQQLDTAVRDFTEASTAVLVALRGARRRGARKVLAELEVQSARVGAALSAVDEVDMTLAQVLGHVGTIQDATRKVEGLRR